MKSFKAKYKNKTKMISNIKDYQTLFQTVKNRFEFTQPFKMSYKDLDENKIEIINQQDYDNINVKTTLIVYIQTLLEFQNISRIQTSINKSNENLGDSVIMGIVNGNTLQQSSQAFLIEQKPILEGSLEYPSQISKKQQNNFLRQDFTQEIIKSSQTILTQEKVKQANAKWRDCFICKEQFTGPKWRCIDLTCFDVDVCPKCKNGGKIYQKHYKNHKFVEIKDEKFISKINFTHAINKIFDSNYDKEIQIENTEERSWISHQDILKNNPKFINIVWSSSTSLVDKITGDFQQWEKNYQSNQIRNK